MGFPWGVGSVASRPTTASSMNFHRKFRVDRRDDDTRWRKRSLCLPFRGRIHLGSAAASPCGSTGGSVGRDTQRGGDCCCCGGSHELQIRCCGLGVRQAGRLADRGRHGRRRRGGARPGVRAEVQLVGDAGAGDRSLATCHQAGTLAVSRPADSSRGEWQRSCHSGRPCDDSMEIAGSRQVCGVDGTIPGGGCRSGCHAAGSGNDPSAAVGVCLPIGGDGRQRTSQAVRRRSRP